MAEKVKLSLQHIVFWAYNQIAGAEGNGSGRVIFSVSIMKPACLVLGRDTCGCIKYIQERTVEVRSASGFTIVSFTRVRCIMRSWMVTFASVHTSLVSHRPAERSGKSLD